MPGKAGNSGKSWFGGFAGFFITDGHIVHGPVKEENDAVIQFQSPEQVIGAVQKTHVKNKKPKMTPK